MIGGAGGQAAQTGVVAGDQGRIERGAAAISNGRPVFDLGVGRFVGGPTNRDAAQADVARSHAANRRGRRISRASNVLIGPHIGLGIAGLTVDVLGDAADHHALIDGTDSRHQVQVTARGINEVR